jgi:hypothetical protein
LPWDSVKAARPRPIENRNSMRNDRMPYYLYLCDQKISGPFSEKSEAWTSASERGLIAVIPSWEEDPPRRSLQLNCSIRPV